MSLRVRLWRVAAVTALVLLGAGLLFAGEECGRCGSPNGLMYAGVMVWVAAVVFVFCLLVAAIADLLESAHRFRNGVDGPVITHDEWAGK